MERTMLTYVYYEHHYKHNDHHDQRLSDFVLGDWPAKWPCRQATRSTYQLVKSNWRQRQVFAFFILYFIFFCILF